MKILSIETSCDETGISILETKGNKKSPVFTILADEINSQIEIHKQYGGVYPALAKREHIKNLPIILETILKKSKIKESEIDLIAVTYGPGLEPALWTGIVFAKELAKKWKKPLIPINHMEGHIFSVFGKENNSFKINKVKSPILSLLVSGGHTELVLIEKLGKYKIIGETLDDASGEAFDKVARMLELPYPGGPEISRLAEEQRKKIINNKDVVFKNIGRRDGAEHNKSSEEDLCVFKNNIFMQKISLPRPMIHSKNFNFSFSGLKTAVLYLIRDLKKENPNILENKEIKRSIALEFENAVVETLVHKTKKAIEKYNIKTVIVAGGVSANKHLKSELKNLTSKKQELLFPEGKLATDNSIMIGIVAYFKYLENGNKKININNIKADGNLRLG